MHFIMEYNVLSSPTDFDFTFVQLLLVYVFMMYSQRITGPYCDLKHVSLQCSH